MAPPPIPAAAAPVVSTVDWTQKVNEAIPWKYVAGAVALVAVAILLHQCVANGEWFVANAKGLVTGTILTLTLAGIGATIFIAKKRWQAWTKDEKINFCAAVGSIVVLGILLMSAGIYRNWANATVKQGFSQAGLIVVPLIGLLGATVASTIWKRKYGHWPHQSDLNRPSAPAPNPQRPAGPAPVTVSPPASGPAPIVVAVPAGPAPTTTLSAAPAPVTVLPPVASPAPLVTAPPAGFAPTQVAAAPVVALPPPPRTEVVVSPPPILQYDAPRGPIMGPPAALPVFIASEVPAIIPPPPKAGPAPVMAAAPTSPAPAVVASAPVATSPPPLTAGEHHLPIAAVLPQ